MDTGISTPVASALATGLVGLIGVPAYRAFGRHFGSGKPSYEALDQLYDDDDGEATEATQKAYTTVMPRSISLIAVVAGLAIAVVQAVLAMIGVVSISTTGGSWLRVAAWALVTLQAIAVFIERDYVKRYALGIHASLSSFLTLLACVVAVDPLTGSIRPGELRTALLLSQISLAAGAWIAFLCIQRRPDVFSDGRAVDREMTTSLLGRLSFSWVISLIRKAEKEKQLEYSDLPQLKRRIRAELLSKRFDGATKYSKLWKTVFVAFRHAIGLQVTIVTMKSILQFVPQYAMLKILEILEAPEAEHPVSIWAWACLLGGVLVLNTVFIENWLFWVVWTELGIPIRNMLSTLVFQKSIRRKDVKGVSKKKESGHEVNAEAHPIVQPDAGTPGQSTALPADTVEETKEDPANDEEVEQKTRQTTINLVGVDASRVAMFLTYAYFYPGTIGQIVISITFLGRLIGAIPLLVGLACFLVSIPMNWWASRNYARLQDLIMSLRDKKLAIANEALQGIRQIKFSALESQWQSKLRDRRELELQALWSAALYDTVIIACYIGSPSLLMAGALATYASLHDTLTPSVAFTTVAILTSLEAALSVLPELTTEGIEAYVSINRIEEYLNAPEIVDSIDPSEQIRFEDAHIAWPADDQEADPDRFILRNVNFTIPPKELTVISGKTGSGKSLLLASLLGEIDKLSGKIYAPKAPRPADRFDSKATRGNWIIDSATAFVAQVPWIENATLKDNILFGLPYDEGRYKKTLEACALTKDLEMLDDGDLTEIGHNGVNLSGGQRWRVSFARALYSRAGILVLDDVFSAVDAHVGRQLFEEALTGELAHGRTRVLVTHHVSLVLPKTRYAIYLADGTVKYAGFVEDLRQAGHLETLMEDNVSPSDSNSEDSDTEVGEPLGPALSKVMSRRSARSAVIDDGGAHTKKDTPKKFVEDEKRETGAIKAVVYRTYFTGSGGLWLWVPIFSMYALTQLFEVGRGWWVTVWTDSYKTQSETHSDAFPFHSAGILQHAMNAHNRTSAPPDNSLHSNTVYYVTVYVVLSFAAVALGAIKYLATFVAGLRASRKLFEGLTYTVLRTPLRWVDTVPVGRILNRFTADFNTIDSGLAGHMGFFMYKVTETAGITGVSFVTSPYMIPLTFVLMLSAAYIGSRFIVGARSVKRLENNAKSPIFELFGSVLTGIATVRGYAKDEEYIERMWKRIDEHGRSFWNLWLMNRWMGFRFALIGAFFSFCVAVVIASADVPASLAGFALAFALQYADAIIWVLRAYAALELDMTAAERVIEFSSLEIESQGGKEAPAAWPSKGRLEVDDLVVGYAPDLPPVLKGISFKAESGERVGVVGRTGAGKSSLTLALFRFLEARQGTVSIDGIDISTLTLHSLRSRLAIIPQDPVLFSGTVRSNLDPFDQHADHELRDALERVHLVSSSSTRPSTAVNDAPTEDTNTNIFKSLSSRISEGGLNLSQGQRQLLCLARAIVAHPRLMVLDEATSAVDKDTDTLIQRSIRDEFAGSTLVVIAHRLSTIADFDRILVLGEGRVVEFGTPRELLQKAEGAFHEMVAQSGEREALEETIMGQENEDAK